MKSLYIVDASGLIFRSYYAIRGMTNQQGQSTNAIYGFIRSLQKIIQDFKPHSIVSVFDGPRSWQSRIDIYPEYKANRTERPPDLSEQLVWAREYCRLMGIPILDVPGVEADDTIGSVAKWAEGKGFHTYICSSDKDLGQLVNDHVSMVYPHKENQLIGPQEIEESFGVPPALIGDYLAIVGDASDNVPGLPGFGPKTAQTLLAQYGSLQGIFDHIDEFTGKKREALEGSRELAALSRKLVAIDLTIDFPKEEEFFTPKKPDTAKLQEFYLHKNFQSLLKEIAPTIQETVSYKIVDDVEEIQKLLASLAKESAFDTETTSLEPLEAKLVGISLTDKGGQGWYIPCNGKVGTKQVVALVKPFFEDPQRQFFGHNSKYDWHILQNYEIDVANLSFDTMIASYVLDASSRQHSLDALSLTHFGKVKIPTTDLIGKGKNQVSMWEVEIDRVGEYACEDVDYTFRLKEKFAPELKERGLERVFYEIDLPLLKVLGKMERRGMFVDLPYLKELGKEVHQEIAQAEKQIFAMAGEEFNLNSPKQLSHILFDKLQIKPLKKTTTGYSTNADVLEALQGEYPIVEHILNYRQMEKLRSTYIEALPQFVNPRTQRVHCTFNQSIAATGRLASQDPNLQNIPVRTEIGRKIRRAFRPQKEGYSYISADYSQIELRLLAHLSEDPTLLEAFHQNMDIHLHTASQIFDIPLAQVTKEQRNNAKAVNFGIIYGQGPYGLSQQLGIKQKEAKDFIERYFDRYGKVKGFIEGQIAKAGETGKAVTMTGRERAIPEIHNKNPVLRQAAERLATNTPLQGTAADLIKLAMLRVEESVPGKMILQIHDELLFEVEDGEIEGLIPKIREAMEGVWDLQVPLIVDVEVGKNWEEC